MNSEKVKLSTLNVSIALGQKVRLYCAQKNIRIRDAVEAALEQYMNSNHAPPSNNPTPHEFRHSSAASTIDGELVLEPTEGSGEGLME